MSKKDLDQVKIEILARLDIRAEFESFGVQCVGNPNRAGWLVCRNPYKKDQHPSASINIGSGSHRGYLVAFNSNGNAGKPYAAWSFFDVAMDFLPGAGGDFKSVLRHYAETTGVQFQKEEDSPPTAELVKKFRDNITPEILEYLHTKRGLSDASIAKYEIGWSSSKSKTDGRNTFPVYNREGLLVNIRRHNSKAKPKTLNWPGHGEARLWGADRLAKAVPGSIAGITEGEFDSMLAEQETGLTSVSPTNGCNAFQRAWVQEFHGKHVVLLWDCDEEGRAAVEKIILPAFRQAVASGEVLSIKVVWLFSKPDKKQKDFTDFIVKAGGTGAQVLKMIEAAPSYGYPATTIGADELPDPDIFFDGKTFLPLELSEYINEHYDLIFDGLDFYRYDSINGYWTSANDTEIEKILVTLLGRRVRRAYLFDGMAILKTVIYQPTNKFKCDPYLINLKNGMFDLRTGELSPHDKKYMSKIQLKIDFDPAARCPRWMQYLAEVFPDDLDKAKTIQEFGGYCLFPEIFIEKCLFLVGGGGNGKSKYINALTRILGGHDNINVAGIEPHMLEERFVLGSLKDKLLNMSTDIDTKTPLASTMLKKIISGELIQADRKFSKDPLLFKPVAKHIFSMNEIPIITDKTFGFERRLIVVRFNQRFDGKNADNHLDQKLEKEDSGIFNWLLLGLKRVVEQNDIYESSFVLRDKKTFLMAVNPVSTFMDEMVDFYPNYSIPKKELYKAYSQWCEEGGIRRLTNIRFYAQVLADYPQIIEKHGEGNSARKFHGAMLRVRD